MCEKELRVKIAELSEYQAKIALSVSLMEIMEQVIEKTKE